VGLHSVGHSCVHSAITIREGPSTKLVGLYKHFFFLILQTFVSVLCLWFRPSLFYINNCPTRCNTKQCICYSASSLYMFRVSTTPIIRSTQNCNYSLRYWSYFLCSYLPPTWPSWPRFFISGFFGCPRNVTLASMFVHAYYIFRLILGQKLVT